MIKKEVVKVTKSEQGKKKVVVSSSASSPYFSSISTSNILSELHALRLRLEGTEGTLSQHVHICVGDEGVHDCGLRISQLEVDADSLLTSKVPAVFFLYSSALFFLLPVSLCRRRCTVTSIQCARSSYI